MESIALLKSDDQGVQVPTTPVRALGIDLGTTNSTVAEVTWAPGLPSSPGARCLEIDQETTEGRYTHVLVPSVVAIHQGNVYVGEGAKRLRAHAADLGLDESKNVFCEAKNDIGVNRTYHRAPKGFQSATEISGRVLEFLREAAEADNPEPARRIVVTVPASFQAPQRRETLRAAELAHIPIHGGDLLDEPIAAFLDYFLTFGCEALLGADKTRTLLVFDFGGGTCDVAVFRLGRTSGKGALTAASLAVSRYHRLGGGDIDRAIVHNVLIPELESQNGLTSFELGFEDKKKFIEPALLGTAENLKISLCIEIAKLRKFGKWESADRATVYSSEPGVRECPIKGRALTLRTPRLNAKQFEALLQPFLERDFLYARETEYRMTCSIFAPLQDALDRCGIAPAAVDFCLLVGGSTLIPQIGDAIRKFFSGAEVLQHKDRDAVQTAVARGAAYHALALELFGKSLIQPVSHDEIALRVAGGVLTLVPQGALLPFPGKSPYERKDGLVVPETVFLGDVELRVEIVAGPEQRRLFSDLWRIPGPVVKGDPIWLDVSYDENQVLTVHFGLEGRDDTFIASLANPLTHVVNPQSKRLKIDELEEQLRQGQVPAGRVPDAVAEVAQLYEEIGQREKALDLLRRALKAKGGADAEILNRMASCAGAMGDSSLEEKCYREAAATGWSGAWFNLALAQRRRGQIDDAIESMERGIASQRQAPYLVLRASLATAQKDSDLTVQLLEEAFRIFGPVEILNDWELGWFLTGAQMNGATDLVEAAQGEQQKRRRGPADTAPTGQLPGMAALPVRRN